MFYEEYFHSHLNNLQFYNFQNIIADVSRIPFTWSLLYPPYITIPKGMKLMITRGV